MGVRLRPLAESDIAAISLYIAARRPSAARRWQSEVAARIVRLGEMPGAGAARFEVAPRLRMARLGHYLILYRDEGRDAVVLRVVHAARDWARLVR